MSLINNPTLAFAALAASHDVGIRAWLRPQQISHNPQDNIANTFQNIKGVYAHYYTNSSQTSPKDGTPYWDLDSFPNSTRNALGIPSDASIDKIVYPAEKPYLSFKVHWTTHDDINGTQSQYSLLRTQRWATQESIGFQGALKGAAPGIPLPSLTEADSEEKHDEYNKKTLQGVHHCLDYATEYVLYFCRRLLL